MNDEIIEDTISKMLQQLASENLTSCQNRKSFEKAANIVNQDLLNDVVGILSKLIATDQIEFVKT